MAKIKLGDRPINFKRSVTFPLIDGTTGQIEMVYKYRTKTEFSQLIDEIVQSAGVPNDDKYSLVEVMGKAIKAQADQILKVAEGWDIEADFTHENIQQLCDEIPAAISAIIESYREAVTAGRLGN